MFLNDIVKKSRSITAFFGSGLIKFTELRFEILAVDYDFMFGKAWVKLLFVDVEISFIEFLFFLYFEIFMNFFEISLNIFVKELILSFWFIENISYVGQYLHCTLHFFFHFSYLTVFNWFNIWEKSLEIWYSSFWCHFGFVHSHLRLSSCFNSRYLKFRNFWHQ